MISEVFIRRPPRLAVVSPSSSRLPARSRCLRIPLSQFPDIVPPRVQVTAYYPGASAAVIEAAVAQPLEAQIVGVDKMIYMKSTSGNDGSYSLTVSFAVGTNPDTATVNVNNRVQTALPQLPQAVQVQGLTVLKRSAAILQFMNLYSEDGKLSPVLHHQLRHHQRARRAGPRAGCRPGRCCSASSTTRCRIWFDTQRLASLSLSASDVVQAIQAQNVQAPVGRIGARPVATDQQFQFNVQTQGTLTTPEQFPQDSPARQSPTARSCGWATWHGSRWGRRTEDTETRINGKPSVGVRSLLGAGRQRPADRHRRVAHP